MLKYDCARSCAVCCRLFVVLRYRLFVVVRSLLFVVACSFLFFVVRLLLLTRCYRSPFLLVVWYVFSTNFFIQEFKTDALFTRRLRYVNCFIIRTIRVFVN